MHACALLTVGLLQVRHQAAPAGLAPHPSLILQLFLHLHSVIRTQHSGLTIILSNLQPEMTACIDPLPTEFNYSQNMQCNLKPALPVSATLHAHLNVHSLGAYSSQRQVRPCLVGDKH